MTVSELVAGGQTAVSLSATRARPGAAAADHLRFGTGRRVVRGRGAVRSRSEGRRRMDCNAPDRGVPALTAGAGGPPSLPAGISRRRLLEGGAALTGLIVAHGAGASPVDRSAGARDSARTAAARLEAELPEPAHATNGDETALPGWIACYSKGLPHNASGEVDPAAYRLLLRAIASRDPADFESIPLGGFLKLANPQAALAENLIGPDPGRLDLVPPPRFASAEQASELIELYWQALLRDVAFEDYETHPMAQRAAADLSRLADFKPGRGQGVQSPRARSSAAPVRVRRPAPTSRSSSTATSSCPRCG
jgi:hypothetical protein